MTVMTIEAEQLLSLLTELSRSRALEDHGRRG
jgi:hypothetical protein